MASVIERLTELEQDMKSIIAENARLRQCVVQLSEIVGETDENPNVEPGPRVKTKPSKADLVRYDNQMDEDEDEYLIICDPSDIDNPALFFAGFRNNKPRWQKSKHNAKRFYSDDEARRYLIANKKELTTPDGYGKPTVY